MATEVRIAGWKVEGLRCPDHKVDFVADGSSGVWPISLIQMPNGTGKTTTLQLIRAALSGSAENDAWEPDRVRAMQKKGSDDTAGRFQVVLLLDARRLSFTMDFDFEAGSVAYSTTLPSGMKQGFHPPAEIERFLRPEFVHFFVFDGELAEHLISREHTDAQVAIDDLFQLQTFDQLISRVRDYWEAKISGRTATEEKGLKRRRNRVKFLRDRIRKLEKKRRALEEEHESVRSRRAEKERRFKAALEAQQAQRERLVEAEAELRRAEDQTRATISEVVAAIKNPCAFSVVVAERLANLKQSLDQVKLPESAAREFFTELAQQDTCVCGRPLTEESREAIRTRARQYLGSENVALLNAMKTQIADEVDRDPGRHEEELAHLFGRLQEDVRSLSECRTQRDAIEAEAATGDPDLESVRLEIEELRQREKELEGALKRFDDPTETAHDKETEGITVLRRRLTEAEQALAEITDTLEIKAKRDILIRILKSAQERGRITLGREICKEANERISHLMPDNRIRIRAIDRCLLLEGQEAGSTGENLSVAYAFLSTLFSRAEHRLPFVVDSPANPIDLQVRAEVAGLIPKLATQFVAFTISSERPGFLDPLEQEMDGGIQYVTLFRKGNPDLEVQAREEERMEESVDGLVVHGRNFFRLFHLDEEA